MQRLNWGVEISFPLRGEVSKFEWTKLDKSLVFSDGDALSERDCWNDVEWVSNDGLLIQHSELDDGSNMFCPCFRTDDEFDLGIDQCLLSFGGVFDNGAFVASGLYCDVSVHVLSS